MSRGDRAATSGNLSTSMRDNYSEHGVSEYYKKVGSTYRNPHFPGVRLCIFAWLNKWWKMECNIVKDYHRLRIFDMACGSGEVTVACLEWWETGKKHYRSLEEHRGLTTTTAFHRKSQIALLALGPDFPRLQVVAADPFTSVAYHDRTSLPCSTLSFKDISEGALPPLTPPEYLHIQRQFKPGNSDEMFQVNSVIEMVICSFALHLVESPSELFSLLWELSLKARWLVVLAPHKKPEIKEGWGWSKWNVDIWGIGSMQDNGGELLHDRVRCRVYRSLNI